jgi:hypothetical protein
MKYTYRLLELEIEWLMLRSYQKKSLAQNPDFLPRLRSVEVRIWSLSRGIMEERSPCWTLRERAELRFEIERGIQKPKIPKSPLTLPPPPPVSCALGEVPGAEVYRPHPLQQLPSSKLKMSLSNVKLQSFINYQTNFSSI